jgi:trk system potassium uptake protein TrkH
MRIQVVFRYVSILLFVLSMSFLLPALYSLWVADGLFLKFLYPVALASSLLLLAVQIEAKEPTVKEAILVVVLTWFLFPALSALLYMETGVLSSFPDAYFESVSGFTTTGASVFSSVEWIPRSVLLWRSTTNWVGGIGFVVFSLSLLPAFGAGGTQLMRLEASKAFEERVLPKVKETARAIFIVYILLTVSEISLLVLAGMSFFDAVNHTFATVATGGFSTRDGSIGAFHSPVVEMIVVLFMLLGAMNLSLYYRAFKARSLRLFFSYYEVKGLLGIVTFSTVFFTAVLLLSGVYSNPLTALRFAVFQVATSATTAGFSSTDYTGWPPSVLAFIMFLSLIGASSGSTAGGIKQFRFIVMMKTVYSELKKTAHPRLVYRVSLGRKTLDLSLLNTVWAFISVYFSTAVVFGVIVAIFGHDLVTSFSASIACITSFGPGLAKVGPAGNFGFFCGFVKLLLSAEMILGRLEVFAVFAVLLPSFWKE